jgi:DNA-binding GntR family transcriptional regulator
MSATTFQKVEPISKKGRVVASLREAIINGLLQSGDQIVEGKIAQQFGVGQGLIREALIDLEHQGFVQRTPFSGTQVSTLDLEDAQQIFDIRIELEPLAFSLAADKATPEQVKQLETLARKAANGARAEDLDVFFDNHLAFRKQVWTIAGNRYLQQTLEKLVIPLYALYLIRRSYSREGILQTVLECIEHQDQIIHAYKIGNGEEAGRIGRDFLIRMKGYLGTRLLPKV